MLLLSMLELAVPTALGSQLHLWAGTWPKAV